MQRHRKPTHAMPKPPRKPSLTSHRRRIAIAATAAFLSIPAAPAAKAQCVPGQSGCEAAPFDPILEVGVDGQSVRLDGVGPFDGYERIDVGGNGGEGEAFFGSIGPGSAAPQSTLPPTLRIGFGNDTSADPSLGIVSVVDSIFAQDITVGVGWNATGELTVHGDVVTSQPDVDAFSPYGSLRVGINATGGAARGDVSIGGDVHANLIVGHPGEIPNAPTIQTRSAVGHLAISGSVHATTVGVGLALGGEAGPYEGNVSIGGDLTLVHPSSGVVVGQRPRHIFGREDIPTPPEISGSLTVGGVTRFTGETPQEPVTTGGPFPAPRQLYVGMSDALGSLSGRFETEAIENADHINVGTNYQGFDGGGNTGELVVRSGGLSNNARFIPTALNAGYRDQSGGPGSIGHVDITGDVDIGAIRAYNDGTKVILRGGETIRDIDILIEGPREPWHAERSGGARLELDRYILNDGRVFLSEDATLAMHVKGAEAGTGYSAIRSRRFPGTVDVGIGATIEVILADVLPEGIYDLIITRSLTFVDMEEQIQVVGMNPERARFEHIIEPITSRFSIHTLRMTIVPEPSTALLLGLGLAGLARTRQRD